MAAAAVMFFSAAPSFAQANSAEPFNTLVNRLAQKFNLNPEDVKSVFVEVRDERMKEWQALFEERLTQAVEDGKINDSQKQAILAKHNELQNQKQSFMSGWDNLTPTERKSKMQETMNSLKSWAEENGLTIDLLQELGFGHAKAWGFGHRNGFRAEVNQN